MKKLLLIVMSLFSVVSTNAQVEKLIYEKNWEGVEYTEWGYLEDPPIWTYYEATDEGLAITNSTVNDHIFDVRVQNGFFSLEEGHDYIVRLIVKVPSDGDIFMLLGSWSSSWYDHVSVTACNDWQVIDIESPNYYCDIPDNAYVLLGFGEMVGTTILKKVQVYERTTQDTYRPFIEEGKVWKVGDYSGNPVRRVEYYYFDGDTIIDGKTCKQMMCQRYVSPDHPDYATISQLPSLSYAGAWYEEDKKVYSYNATSKQFIVKYDFSVDANETLQIGDIPYVIGPKQTEGLKGFKGVYRDVWMHSDIDSIYSSPWLEGVGSLYRPTANVFPGYVDPAASSHEGTYLKSLFFLMSCTVGDEVIYYNDEYEDGATSAEARKNRFDFTHTIKIKPKTRMRSEDDQSLYGEYNEQELDINLDPLNDTYQVYITDESGNAVYEKSINAGNIVGLNIDISTYPEGLYTVTVENSNESFIGEFDAQLTGIEAIRSKNPEVRGYIYNLQGQRLSSLHTGLNIVHGQKIYVK